METKCLTWRDIAKRYGLGESMARKRIREIKSFFPGGGDAPIGKIMAWELDAWEYHQADIAFKNFLERKYYNL